MPSCIKATNRLMFQKQSAQSLLSKMPNKQLSTVLPR